MQYNLAQFKFNKERKHLYAASELFCGGFPRTIEVVSNHTNRVMTFVQDDEAAMAAECWDGEMMLYKVYGTDHSNGKITSLSVAHEF